MTQNSFQMFSSAVSDRGLSDKRPQNEDSYLEMPERGLFAVADGVGGAQAGDVASQMAMELLAEAFYNQLEIGDIEELMNIAITRANGAIFQMSHELSQLSTMATTIVALQVSGNIATIGHVGDSRLYRLDSQGNLFRETQDHSVVEEEVRAGRMTPEQAENHPSKNVISRALGAESLVEIDMKTIMFEPNTTFLLCSDGITRHISDVEIRDLLALPHPPVVICQQMKEICYERGAEDNLTAVIVRLAGSEVHHETDFEENTVASVREPAAAVFSSQEEFTDEIPTQNLQFPQETHNFEMETETVSEYADAVGSTEENYHIAATESETPSVIVESDDVPSFYNEESSSGGLGKPLLFLAGLLIGGLLGAGAYYLLGGMKTPEELPKIPQMQTSNIAYQAFEDNRRNVDQDPEGYLKTAGTKAEDAEDFYLLGRANLLLGKYTEAKSELEKAKQGLAEYSSENKAILQNEVAIALSAINNAESQKALEAGKTKITVESSPATNTSENKSVSNSNGGTSANN